MTAVRKAYGEDFEQILPLLHKFNPDTAKWKRLFINHWRQPENYFGFVLTDEEKIVGFLGTIFSTRVIQGKREKFCNLSTWIVDEQYKKHGLSLFLPVLELEDYTITNFSSAEKTYIISKKLGFEDLEANLRYLFPLPKFNRDPAAELDFNPDLIGKILTGEDLRIFQDHLKFECHHVLIRKGGEQCYLILKESPAYLKPVYYSNRVLQKLFRSNYIQEHAFVGHIHYVSNKALFSQVIGNLGWKICWKWKLVGLLANASWLLGSSGLLGSPYKTFSTPLFKSKTVRREDIDSLYSENFVINV